MRHPLIEYILGATFGQKMWYGKHKGQDYAPKDRGRQVPAVAVDHGQVIRTGYTPTCGLGVDIKTNKGYWARYCHLSHVDVRKGQRVKWGQKIAYIGNSGLSRGVHLHLAIKKNGKTIDPLTVIEKKPLLITKVNFYFRQIFKRDPDRAENLYWARRVLGQKKPKLDTPGKLINSMKYWDSKGKTKGYG